MPGVTSADVARESGVSRTTVSYVLNAKEGVAISEPTRQRVRDAALRPHLRPAQTLTENGPVDRGSASGPPVLLAARKRIG